MVKKICPICDQVMKSSHFCWTCRSWIRHPYEREMNFYLNERHLGNELQCDYHGANQPRQTGVSSSEIYADTDLNRQLNKKLSQTADYRGSGSRSTAGGGVRPNGDGINSGKGAYIIVAVAVGIVVLIGAGTAVIGSLYDSVTSGFYENFSYNGGVDDYDFSGEADENYRELEDDEVKAAGVRCNTYYHFRMMEEDMAPAVSAAVLSAGYKIASESTYSYNDATLDGDEEWTYYSTSHTIYVAGNDMAIRDDLSQWVEMDYDTATGELHSYRSQLADKVKSIMIMTEFLKGIESNYGISSDESSILQITRDMQAELDAAGGYTCESDVFYVTAQLYSDGLYLEVSCNQED